MLELLADKRAGAGLAELAVAADAPKTSLVGLLAGLNEVGGVERDADGRYRLGPRFMALALRATSGRDLLLLARPVLQDLAEESGETAVLGTLAPDAEMATYLDRVESRNPIRYAVTIGERRELYCTAIGKVLLAHFSRTRREAYLAQTPLEAFTANTRTDAAVLRQELAAIRAEGLVRTCDERIPGASAVAAPVFGGDGTLVAAIMLAGPSQRIADRQKSLEALVRAAALDCSTRLGAPDPAAPKDEPA